MCIRTFSACKDTNKCAQNKTKTIVSFIFL